jgi:hypothetical protein
MAFNDRDAFTALRGTNAYVPGMQYSAALMMGKSAAFSLGRPALGAATGVLGATAGNTANGTATTISDIVSDATYGRGVIVTPSADPGAGGLIVDIRGFDYLGQPMLARVTIASGGAVAVATKKAFYRVTSVTIVDNATNAITFTLGWTDELGLPYKGRLEWAKEDGAFVATATMEGTDTLADTTDPATATTNDPRGNYNPTTALDGVKEIVIGMTGDPAVNASGNGGLHGIRHYYA